MKFAMTLAALLGAGAVHGDVMPTPDRSVNRSLPDDYDFTKDTEYQKKYRELIEREETARSTLQGAGAGGVSGQGAAAPPEAREGRDGSTPASASGAASVLSPAGGILPTPPEAVGPSRTLPRQIKARSHRLNAARAPSAAALAAPGDVPATGTLVFTVSKEAEGEGTMTVLPAGSFVKARVVSGVEANTLEPYPVLLQLEYAFTGPNKTKIDLSNCFMIAKARANLSTERVIMETETLSCVRENGEHFKTAAKGYTAGDDSTFGATGTLISKQGQVLLAAVLASVAKNAGEAVAAAQQTTSVATGGLGTAQTATNVTGDQAKYIAGRSVVDGAGMIAQWYLDYARQLVPAIAVGSGQTVHVVMLETIRVPTLTE